MLEGIKEQRERDLNQLRNKHKGKQSFTTSEIEEGLRQVSVSMRDEQAEHEKIKALLAKEKRDLYVPRKLPRHFDQETGWPKHYELDKARKYGKSARNHSYTHATQDLHILAIWYKQGKFLDTQLEELIERDIRIELLFAAIEHHRDTDLRPLMLPYCHWEGAKEPDKNLQTLMGAALLHYDMDVISLVQFIGGRHMGEHRRAEECLFWLKHILTPKTYQDLERALLEGNPAKLVYHNKEGFEQFKQYKQQGNLNLHEEPAAVAKQLAKEQARQHSILLPGWMASFVPNLMIMPMGILLKEDKKARVYRHASLKVNESSMPVNALVKPQETEPEIEYAHRLQQIVELIFDLRFTKPLSRILLLDMDTSGAFCHLLFHPNAMLANGSLVGDSLVIPTGLHFGGNFGPADFEAIAHAKMELFKYLYYNCKYQRELNEDLTDKLEVHLPERDRPLAQAMARRVSTQATLTNGEPNVESYMYVDDELAAQPEEMEGGIVRLGSSSAEASYLTLGYYPGPVAEPTLPPAIAYDKLEGRKVGPQREMIGYIPDSDELLLRLPPRRLEKLELLIVNQWPRSKKSYHAKEAAKLLGQLQSCAAASSWFRVLALRIGCLVKKGLEANFQALQQHQKRWGFAKRRLRQNPKLYNISNGEAKQLGISKETAKLLWAANAPVETTAVIFDELEWILQIIREHKDDQLTWAKPFSHIVGNFETTKAWQDASLEYGIGGFCPGLNYYFSIPWEKISPIIKETFLNGKGKEHELGLTSINVCESIAELVQFAAEITAYLDPKYSLPCPPKVHNAGDNTSANTWADGKARDPSAKTRRLCKLRVAMARKSQVGSMHSYINTKDNWFADRLSRECADQTRAFLEQQTSNKLAHLLCPFQTKNNSGTKMFLRNFQPSQHLLSLICTALWNSEEVLFPSVNINDLGRFAADKSSSISLSWGS